MSTSRIRPMIELATPPPSNVKSPTPEVSVFMVDEEYGDLVYDFSDSDENFGRVNVWRKLGRLGTVMTENLGPFNDNKMKG